MAISSASCRSCKACAAMGSIARKSSPSPASVLRDSRVLAVLSLLLGRVFSAENLGRPVEELARGVCGGVGSRNKLPRDSKVVSSSSAIQDANPSSSSITSRMVLLIDMCD